MRPVRRSSIPLRVAALALLWACVGDPLTVAGQTYAGEMQPLFVKNRALGEQFLQVASKVKKNEADATTVANLISPSAVSAAAGLADGAAGVHPTDSQIAAAHSELVAAWRHRADAYSAVANAWKAQDTAAFDKAVHDAGVASDEESAAADHLDKVLAPVGVSIDLYP